MRFLFPNRIFNFSRREIGFLVSNFLKVRNNHNESNPGMPISAMEEAVVALTQLRFTNACAT